MSACGEENAPKSCRIESKHNASSHQVTGSAKMDVGVPHQSQLIFDISPQRENKHALTLRKPLQANTTPNLSHTYVHSTLGHFSRRKVWINN